MYLLCAGTDQGLHGGIVCPRPDAFRTDASGRAEPSCSSLREEIENGERHRGLIDPASLIELLVRKERERERQEKEEIGDLLLSSPYWVISGQELFTKYCGVLFC